MTDIREVLDEIEKGLPGVTPGPWRAWERRVVNPAGDAELGNWTVAEVWWDTNREHLSRLDPQTMLTIIELARKGLAADAGETVAGWKLVPIEPTAAMRQAAFGTYHRPPADIAIATEHVSRIYAAMLSASPTQEPA